MANRRRRGPIVNRRHMARQERERLFSNYITVISFALIGIVVVLVVYGLIVSRFIQPNQPVATVNGEDISTREFQGNVRYQRGILINQWIQMADFMSQFGGDENSSSFFIQQLTQIEQQLDPNNVGREVLNNLVADRLIRAEAAKRGITVTEEEINQTLEESFGFYGGNPRPTPTAVPTFLPTSTLSPQQMTLVAPTATATMTFTESLTDTAAVSDEGEGTEEGSTGEEPAATPTLAGGEPPAEPTEEPTPLPTETPYTREAFEADYTENIESLDPLGFTEEDLRYLVESDLYYRKLMDEITKDLSQVQDHVWVRQILVATEEEAQEVIDRLEAGENFAILAAEVSIDQNTSFDGGDMGWFARGQAEYIEDTAFALEIGEVSEPVQSQFGFHVLQLLGHEERRLTTSEFEELKASTFDEWITNLRQESDIEIYDYWANRIPTDPTVPVGGVQGLLAAQQQQQLLQPQP